jgi:hypothetical protein
VILCDWIPTTGTFSVGVFSLQVAVNATVGFEREVTQSTVVLRIRLDLVLLSYLVFQKKPVRKKTHIYFLLQFFITNYPEDFRIMIRLFEVTTFCQCQGIFPKD